MLAMVSSIPLMKAFITHITFFSLVHFFTLCHHFFYFASKVKKVMAKWWPSSLAERRIWLHNLFTLPAKWIDERGGSLHCKQWKRLFRDRSFTFNLPWKIKKKMPKTLYRYCIVCCTVIVCNNAIELMLK